MTIILKKVDDRTNSNSNKKILVIEESVEDEGDERDLGDEYDDNNDHGDDLVRTDNIDVNNVKRVVQNLVRHYNQEVHNHTVFASPCCSSKGIPYFHNDNPIGTTPIASTVEPLAFVWDDEEQTPPPQQQDSPKATSIPPVIRFWLDELEKDLMTATTKELVSALVAEYLEGYEEYIRPLLLPPSSSSLGSSIGCVPALQHYELLLTVWLQRIRTITSSSAAAVSSSSTMKAAVTDDDNNINDYILTKIIKIIHILCMDVTIWTSSDRTKNLALFQPPPSSYAAVKDFWESATKVTTNTRQGETDGTNDDDGEKDGRSTNNHECHEYVRRNIIIPTLLRLLERTLYVLSFRGCDIGTRTISSSITSQPSKRLNVDTLKEQENDQLLQQRFRACLRRVVITVLAFPDSSNDERFFQTTTTTTTAMTSVLPSLTEGNTRNQINFISPITVAPSLIDNGGRLDCAADHNFESLCCYPPTDRILSTLLLPKHDSRDGDIVSTRNEMFKWIDANCLHLDTVDWESVALDTTSWNDTRTRIAQCVAQQIWYRLDKLLQFSTTSARKDCDDACGGEQRRLSSPLITIVDGETKHKDLNESDNWVNNDGARVEMRVLKALGGIVSILPDVRSHFFGRDDDDVTAWWVPQQRQRDLISLESSSRPRVVMGRRVPPKKIIPEKMQLDKPFIAIPSRTAVALSFLRVISSCCYNQNEDVDDTREKLLIQHSLFEHGFPICASLTDSTRPTFTALGASSFINLYESLISIQSELSGVASDEDKDQWALFITNSLTVLEMAFQGSRVGPVVVAIGQAQCRLMAMCQANRAIQNPITIKSINERRRTITQKWLSALDISSCGHTAELSPLDILRGGVIPLLMQHTDDDTGVPADALEFGRLGLRALLSLIDGEFVNTINNDDRTKIAASVALTNLFWAAYPILPHHGGKILSHMLSAAASAEFDSPQQVFLMYVSAVALVMCGPKFTEEVFDEIIVGTSQAKCVDGDDDGNAVEGGEGAEKHQYQPVLVDIARRVWEGASELMKENLALN